MATTHFLYRSRKEFAPLTFRIQFYCNDNYLIIGAKTKLEVSKHYWEKTHNKIRFSDIEEENKKKEVTNEQNKISNFILEAFEAENPENISKVWLASKLENYYNPIAETKIPTRLIEYIDFYIDYRKQEISQDAIKKNTVIKNKLQRMESELTKPILIKDVNEDFKKQFVDYQKKEHYSNNTIARDIKYLKSFCRHARFLGLETSPQLDGLKTSKEETNDPYLNLEELKQIQGTELHSEYLENARDWLIISCFTGQRVSDFLRFNKEMIRVIDGKSLLEFRQKKTKKLMTIPLAKQVLIILEKRNGNFPRPISDQKYNRYIKEICRLSGITQLIEGAKSKMTEKGKRDIKGTYQKWELVSSHIGRRSFATNHYGSIPTAHLIHITGHSSEALFLSYIKKSSKDIALEISKYF